MSLKCSIFGHRFGEPDVERDRDESGSEVVITIRETQTCGRCGHQRVVSENKEVTTLETPDDAPDGTADEEADGAAESAASAPDPDVPDAVDDIAAVDDAGSDDASDGDPETEDAQIIEDSPDQSIVEEAEPEEPVPGDPGTGATGEADAESDDAVILDDEEPDESAEREPGAWPEEPEDDSPEWEPPTDDSAEATVDSAPDPDPGPDVEPAGEAVTVPQGTFHCPECGFSTDVEASSLRAGDFCPDCHTGTLVHEADAE